MRSAPPAESLLQASWRQPSYETNDTVWDLSNAADVSGTGADADADMPDFDWLAVIEEECRTDSIANTTSLAHSSALQAQARTQTPSQAAGATHPAIVSTPIGKLAGITSKLLQGWEVGEVHLLNHFLHSVARSLTLVRDEENPLICAVVPLAFANTAVRHALAALSACHLARTYPNFESDLLRHRSLALQALKLELEPSGAQRTVAPLAATLLLCLLEVSRVPPLVHAARPKARPVCLKGRLRLTDNIPRFVPGTQGAGSSTYMVQEPSSATRLLQFSQA
jgi:hypothetical protein